MLKNHLHRHGLSFSEHFKNNWSLTLLALKSAYYTFGHGLTPRVSGLRASELHNQIWVEGRKASLKDLKHRLDNDLYDNKAQAQAEYKAYAALYNEEPLMTKFGQQIEDHYYGK
jgi:hypothetical protein